MSRLPITVLTIISALFVWQPAQAGWLSELGQIASKAGRTGGKLTGEASVGLETAARTIAKLPPEARAAAIAAEALPDGAWRFRNAAGDTITATSSDGIKGALSGLTAQTDKLAFYLDEDAAFAGAASLDAFPGNAKLHVVIDDQTYPLLRQGKAEAARLYAEVDGDVIVAMTDRQLFSEAIWQLKRPLGRSGIRIASLDTKGAATLPSIGPRSVDGVPPAETVDAAALGSAISAMRGQTLIVSGSVDGDTLHFTGISGESGTVPVADLMRAAELQDVNLLLLDAGTPRQPGGSTWLFQERGIAHLDAAMAKASLGDFINALARGQGRMEITADWGQGGHLRLTTAPVRPEVPAASGEAVAEGLGQQALDAGAELAKSLTGHVVPHTATASLNDRDTQWDLDNRLIPGIPAGVQLGYAISWLAGLVGFSQARWWWRLITRTKAAVLNWPWRVAYEVGYWLLFAPLVGPLAFVATILWSSLEQFLGLWRLLASRFRRKQEPVRG